MCSNKEDKKEYQIKYIYFDVKLVDNTYFENYTDFK